METATDPVCGMSIEASTAAGTISHGDTTYYFCSSSCQERFEADPDQFTTARG
jgi:Cu+-exporting ATPase